MVKLSIYKKADPLCENFQANEMKFAFVNVVSDGQWETINTMVQCREYFNEFLMINHHPKFPFKETYGFRYKHSEYPWQMESPKMAIKFKDEAHMKEFIDNIGALHHVEHFHKFKPTVIHFVESILTHTIVVEFDPSWTKKCLTFNIYTLLLKLCALGMDKLPYDKFVKVLVNGRVPTELQYLKDLGKDIVNSYIENITTINDTPAKYVDGSAKYRDRYEVHGASGINTFKYRSTRNDDNIDNMDDMFVNTIIKIISTPANNNFFKDVA